MTDTARMPFGKYRGKQISALRTPYLAWLVRACEFLQTPRNQRIKTEIDDELERRAEASIPAHIKTNERQVEDEIYLRWWLNQGGAWFRRGFPPSLPSDEHWLPPYELHHGSSPEWDAFQKSKAEYRERRSRVILGQSPSAIMC